MKNKKDNGKPEMSGITLIGFLVVIWIIASLAGYGLYSFNNECALQYRILIGMGLSGMIGSLLMHIFMYYMKNEYSNIED